MFFIRNLPAVYFVAGLGVRGVRTAPISRVNPIHTSPPPYLATLLSQTQEKNEMTFDNWQLRYKNRGDQKHVDCSIDRMGLLGMGMLQVGVDQSQIPQLIVSHLALHPFMCLF